MQNEDYWVAVMKVADLYNIAAAKEDATRGLANRVRYLGGCPIQAIELGRRFNIKEWFEHGFRELVTRNLLTYTVPDTERLGLRCMMGIAKTQCALQDFRKLLAFVPPPLHHSRICLDHRRCSDAYDDQWWKYVGKQLFDPANVTATPCSDVPSILAHTNFVGMTMECWVKTRDAMDESPFHKEEKIIDDCIARLLIQS